MLRFQRPLLLMIRFVTVSRQNVCGFGGSISFIIISVNRHSTIFPPIFLFLLLSNCFDQFSDAVFSLLLISFSTMMTKKKDKIEVINKKCGRYV